jgi:pimeloyl-ACP methyl ester carboxylesterase
MMRLASRVDPDLGLRELAGFIGPVGDALAATLHLPAGEPRAAVVVCPSICVDFTRNYRREVELARALAAAGLATQRFQYRGTGNSDGDAADMTFDRMVADAAVALEHLADHAGPVPVAFVGSRFGALIAAAAAHDHPGAPLVLVEASLDPVRFFREGFRARMAQSLRERDEARRTTATMLQELAEKGSVDVMGHSVDRRLYESASGHLLLDLLGESRRQVLWLEAGAGSAASDGPVKTLLDRGFALDVEQSGDNVAWWFLDDTDVGSDDLVAHVVPWLAGHLGAEVH